jgi:hypothetical protein
MYESMPVTALMHCALAPPAVSPRKPFLLLALSHSVASRTRSRPMVAETQSGDVPEPSVSRYSDVSRECQPDTR